MHRQLLHRTEAQLATCKKRFDDVRAMWEERERVVSKLQQAGGSVNVLRDAAERVVLKARRGGEGRKGGGLAGQGMGEKVQVGEVRRGSAREGKGGKGSGQDGRIGVERLE